MSRLQTIGSNFVPFNSFAEVGNDVQYLKLNEVLDTFHHPRLTKLVRIITRQVRLFVLTSEELYFV